MEQSGTLFEEFRDRWVAYSLFMRLNLGDFSDGEFRLHPNRPQWRGLLGRLEDLETLERHTAADDAGEDEAGPSS